MIKFSFVNIKDKSTLYTDTVLKLGSWRGQEYPDVTLTSSENYYTTKLSALKQNSKIDDYIAKGYNGRIESFLYEISIRNEKHLISFTIDTYEQINQLTIVIEYDQESTTDSVLENLKFDIKNIIIKDWEKCVWLYDKQSEIMASNLYTKMYEVENLIREFVNNVMNKILGVNWINSPEFHKFQSIHKNRCGDFKRTVENFKNIDDTLISINTESLFEIMETTIYHDHLQMDNGIQDTFHLKRKLFENKNISNALKELYTVKYNLWDEFFSKILPDDIDTIITDFIKNRNHIAHNKPVGIQSSKKIEESITSMINIITTAISKITDIEMSQEHAEMIEAEEENATMAAEEKKLYLLSIKQSEAGVTIRTEEEIIQFFNEELEKFYSSIRDNYYFSPSVFFTELSVFKNMHVSIEAFQIYNEVSEKDTLTIFASIEVDDDEGGYSTITIEVAQSEKTILDEVIEYTNGETEYNSFNSNYMPIADSYFNSDATEQLANDITTFIEKDMNSIKNAMDLTYDSDGFSSSVADVSCAFCEEHSISTDDKIYPYGKCGNCGEENELECCNSCDALYNKSDTGDDYLCPSCRSYVERDD